MIDVLKKLVIKYRHYLIGALVILLLTISTVYFAKSYYIQMKINKHNIEALTDTITYYQTKNGKLVAEKNILIGDMSVVGPRPEMLENVQAYTKDMPEFELRLRVKAGLTGYAQIFGKYNTSPKDKLILDLMYIENYSIFLDIKLILQTVMVFLKIDDSTEGFDEEDDTH